MFISISLEFHKKIRTAIMVFHINNLLKMWVMFIQIISLEFFTRNSQLQSGIGIEGVLYK